MNLKINKTFILYVFSAGSSFAIDLLLFSFFNFLLGHYLGKEAIMIATVMARFLSSVYNFLINSKVVFQKYEHNMIWKYYLLAIIQMMVSAVSVYLINKFLFDMYATIIKFFVDMILFIVNYFIQKKFIFK